MTFYIRFLLLCIATLCISIGCVVDPQLKERNTIVPEQLNDGWSVKSPENSGIHTDSLNKIYKRLTSENEYLNAQGLLIVKDSSIVFETYCRTPGDRDHYHHIMSSTKSVTSLVFGIAKAHGGIDSLSRTLYSFFKENFPDDSNKKTITLEQLLTMRSGIQFDNGVFSTEIMVDKPDNQFRYILNKPLYANPGDSFYYRDCDPQLIGYVIQKVTGVTERDFADKNLFKPMGITDYYWESSPENVTLAAHALHLKPRDMAKLGLLVLNHGKWNGTQLVDSSWISTSTSPHASTVVMGNKFDFGYYWWVLPEYKAFTTWGHGGNFIFIVPAKKMVIVMISSPDVNDEKVGTMLPAFIDLVRPVII